MTKIRDPIQGLRNKLRNHLRAAGVQGKFSTQVNRDKTISVYGDVSDKSIVDFDGYRIRYGSKTLN